MRKMLVFMLFGAIAAGCGSSTDETTTTGDTGATDTGGADSAQIDSASDSSADSASDSSADSPVDSSTDSASDSGADSGKDAPADSPGDGGSFACGDKTCTAGQLCTRTYTSGGACMVCTPGDDASTCPVGKHCSGA